MNISKRLMAAAAASLLALTACGADSTDNTPADAPSAESITIEHTQGTTTLDGPAQTIVALDLGALDTLNALGVADRVVGIPEVAAMPEALADFSDVETVGTMQEPNLEKIAELNPDLVIAGFRSAKLTPELAKNFNVIDVTYGSDESFYDGVAYASTLIGQAVGLEDETDEQLAELRETIDDAKAKVNPEHKALIVMTTGGKAGAHGAESRYGVVHKDLGIKPALDNIKTESHGDPISFEAIQQANPDLLIVVDRDAAVGQEGAAAEQVLDNELVASTNAWKNDQVVYLDGGRWYLMIHGLDNSVEMINEIAEAL
ncbi:siderophore ABC transporter substrate-binding protein [Tessaracoccus flavus]|uniref:Uncharacterized protein n=1 Tax=Tessaracoccus flavus TaxID=1610493 RepID=A0A1Q2CGE1_9ACTN|nr:ABC transporter substrate-binding protein [Tessaracoccus flavus]AQP45167.1 hypothetical protein RPIT_10470 [Tessaracoccus flavus]SDY54476.1 iron complex transport system substrate-binding protein [Tessaracoccus flavus]